MKLNYNNKLMGQQDSIKLIKKNSTSHTLKYTNKKEKES